MTPLGSGLAGWPTRRLRRLRAARVTANKRPAQFIQHRLRQPAVASVVTALDARAGAFIMFTLPRATVLFARTAGSEFGTARGRAGTQDPPHLTSLLVRYRVDRGFSPHLTRTLAVFVRCGRLELARGHRQNHRTKRGAPRCQRRYPGPREDRVEGAQCNSGVRRRFGTRLSSASSPLAFDIRADRTRCVGRISRVAP